MPMDNIKYGLVQSFNFIVNARTESCLQDVELGHEEIVYLGLTLGLILNCFVKHYGSTFLISEQELFAWYWSHIMTAFWFRNMVFYYNDDI